MNNDCLSEKEMSKYPDFESDQTKERVFLHLKECGICQALVEIIAGKELEKRDPDQPKRILRKLQNIDKILAQDFVLDIVETNAHIPSAVEFLVPCEMSLRLVDCKTPQRDQHYFEGKLPKLETYWSMEEDEDNLLLYLVSYHKGFAKMEWTIKVGNVCKKFNFEQVGPDELYAKVTFTSDQRREIPLGQNIKVELIPLNS